MFQRNHWVAQDVREVMPRQRQTPLLLTVGAGIEHRFVFCVVPEVGGTLIDFRRRQLKPGEELPPGLAVRFGTDALLALQHLHSVGYVHRDLHPRNLLVNRRPSDDQPFHLYLTGFELAHYTGKSRFG